MAQIVKESLNSFVRTQDPKKALNLGYEGKIRNFFRQYNIPDEDYIIKEDGEIVFTSLLLSYSDITELPDNLTFNGDLYLEYTPINKLPDNLRILHNLHLRNTNITELPKTLHIGGYLYLCDTHVKKIPNTIKIGRHIVVFSEQRELIDYIKHSKFKNKLEI